MTPNPRHPAATPTAASPGLWRTISLAVAALCVAYGVGNVLYSASTWTLADVDAYWEAANRLRSGGELYPHFADVNAADVYRYAPWFAVAWVPLTYLPREVADVTWAGVLVAAAASVLVTLLRATRSPAALAVAFLVGSFLFLGASFGNVHPLIVAALVHGAERRSGPLWVALTASLKATPILYVLVYAARREWTRVAWTIGLTTILVAPMLILGAADYTTDPGWSHSLYAISPALFAFAAAASVIVAAWVGVRHPKLAWLAASVAVIMTLPRYFAYELTYLLVGAVPVVSTWRQPATREPSR